VLDYACTFKQLHPLMTSKSLLCFVCLLGASLSAVNAQTVVITDDATYTVGAASSVLDVKSTTKGFLVPRMTTAQRTAVVSPADGLLVYQTDGVKGFFNYNTTTSAWVALGSASGASWTVTGNTGTTYTTNFLGTTDKKGLRLRTNNTQRMMIDSIGHMAVGLNSDKAPLTVPLTIKDTLEIRGTAGTGSVATLLFNTNSATSTGAGTGDIRIVTDGGDLFWQGGIGRYLQMGSYWPTIIGGDRQSGPPPLGSPSGPIGVLGTAVLIQGARDLSVPLAVQPNSATQTANLQEWRNYNGARVYSFMDAIGNYAGPSAFLTSTAAAAVPLTITENASQTGNLIEFKNSAGTVLTAINAAGNFTGSAASAGAGTGSFGTVPAGGTAVKNIFRTTVTNSDVTVLAQGGERAYTFPVTGLNVNATVIANISNPAAPTGLVIAYTYCSTAGTLGIVIANTGAAQSIPSGVVFNITVIQ